jgi:glycosyltransferase involved in cell wall biosynthesis
MEMMKDLSVILVNTNNGEVLFPCLESIFKHTKDLDYEVIVVDNGSTDGSLERLKCDYGSRVRVVENGANMGFCKANNRGMEQAEGRAVILLNSDTELLNNALKTLCDFLFQTKKWAHVEGVGVSGVASRSSLMVFTPLSRECSDYPVGSAGHQGWAEGTGRCAGNERDPFRVEYICGADLMIKKAY